MDDFYQLSNPSDKLHHGLGKLEKFAAAGNAINENTTAF